MCREKGENTGYQHFLLFPECFQKLLSLGCLNTGLHDKVLRLNSIFSISQNAFKKFLFLGCLTYYHTMTTFDHSGEETF